MIENQNFQCVNSLKCDLVVVVMMEIMFKLKIKMFMLRTVAVFTYAQTIEIKTLNDLKDCKSNIVFEI